ncbi:MAG: hypothetical protein H6579_07670 [Chitinophagales bacterium]|nr:hypothetical protein [Bacteroidota bacterium]MCB9256990.1 hypothetical protein [Chitinophagales bacterium]
MKYFFNLTLILALFSLISCKKEKDLSNEDYLLFGHFYGMCMGESCIEYYKLDAAHLYEDMNDNYNGAPFDFVELNANKFELTKDLIDFFPSELLSEADGTMGCPDCADQGGILISYYFEGSLRTWRLDKDKNNVPSYLHSFMDKVDEKITLINL